MTRRRTGYTPQRATRREHLAAALGAVAGMLGMTLAVLAMVVIL